MGNLDKFVYLLDLKDWLKEAYNLRDCNIKIKDEEIYCVIRNQYRICCIIDGQTNPKTKTPEETIYRQKEKETEGKT